MSRDDAERILREAASGPRPGQDPLTAFLANAAGPARDDELAGEGAAVAAFLRARLEAPVRRRSLVTRVLTVKATIALGLCATAIGGAALAAGTGTLPGPLGDHRPASQRTTVQPTTGRPPATTRPSATTRPPATIRPPAGGVLDTSASSPPAPSAAVPPQRPTKTKDQKKDQSKDQKKDKTKGADKGKGEGKGRGRDKRQQPSPGKTEPGESRPSHPSPAQQATPRSRPDQETPSSSPTRQDDATDESERQLTYQ